jgi:hypothetical protein
MSEEGGYGVAADAAESATQQSRIKLIQSSPLQDEAVIGAQCHAGA